MLTRGGHGALRNPQCSTCSPLARQRLNVCVTWPVLPENTGTSGDPKWFDLFASRVSGLAVWLHPVWATSSVWPPCNYVVAFLECGRPFQFWSSMTPCSKTVRLWTGLEIQKPRDKFRKPRNPAKLDFPRVKVNLNKSFFFHVSKRRTETTETMDLCSIYGKVNFWVVFSPKYRHKESSKIQAC